MIEEYEKVQNVGRGMMGNDGMIVFYLLMCFQMGNTVLVDCMIYQQFQIKTASKIIKT